MAYFFLLIAAIVLAVYTAFAVILDIFAKICCAIVLIPIVIIVVLLFPFGYGKKVGQSFEGIFNAACYWGISEENYPITAFVTKCIKL